MRVACIALLLVFAATAVPVASAAVLHVCTVPGQMYCVACVNTGTEDPCMRGWDYCAGQAPNVIVCVSKEREP